MVEEAATSGTGVSLSDPNPARSCSGSSRGFVFGSFAAFRLLDAGKSGPFLEPHVDVAAAIAELAAGFKGWGACSTVAPGVHGLEVDVEVMSGVFSSQ